LFLWHYKTEMRSFFIECWPPTSRDSCPSFTPQRLASLVSSMAWLSGDRGEWSHCSCPFFLIPCECFLCIDSPSSCGWPESSKTQSFIGRRLSKQPLVCTFGDELGSGALPAPCERRAEWVCSQPVLYGLCSSAPNSSEQTAAPLPVRCLRSTACLLQGGPWSLRWILDTLCWCGTFVCTSTNHPARSIFVGGDALRQCCSEQLLCKFMQR